MKRKEADIRKVKITGGFWASRQKLICDVSLPYMEKILSDEIPDIPKSHAFANFRIAAGQEKGSFYGMVFQDSDVAKWLEASSYSLAVKYNPELDKRMDNIIDTICLAQWDDGYLNTYFTLVEPENRWKNLLECHELYCAGHMIEAGVAHFESTGKTSLLHIVEKLADHIISIFGEGKRDGIPGHQEIEIGLLRLYHATGQKKYLDMASRFLDLRGQDKEYFNKNTPEATRKYGDYKISPSDTVYNQSDMPVREQYEPRGHAVRQMYMLTAMADEALTCNDKPMADACRRMFDAIVTKQMYVTGALGSLKQNEAFSVNYHLPTDTMYGETCAAVAMCFFAEKMLLLENDGKYADILELELYNGALAGMQQDGKRFFYVNPLDADCNISGKVSGYEHILTSRPSWYGCACCPPNLARLIASLGKYIFSEDDNAVYSHLFIPCEADMALAKISLSTDYPRHGGAEYIISPKKNEPFTIAIHIPSHIHNFLFTINGSEFSPEIRHGYAYIKRQWTAGEKISVAFDISPRLIYGSSKVRDCAGRVAVARGPVIYCLESVDNGNVPLHSLRLGDGEISERWVNDEALGNVIMLEAEGTEELPEEQLYFDKLPEEKNTKLCMVPYYTWGNRGKGSMLVWIRR